MEHIAASMYKSDTESDADSTGTEDYSIDTVSDKDVNDFLEQLDDAASSSTDNTNKHSKDEVESTEMEMPDNTERIHMDLLKDNYYSESSGFSTEFNYTLGNSYEKMEGLNSTCTISNKMEAADGVTVSKDFSTKKPSDSTDCIEDKLDTVHGTKQSVNIERDTIHLKPDDDNLKVSLDGKERPRIVLKLRSLEQDNPKRRPRKSTDPKRVVPQNHDLERPTDDLKDEDFNLQGDSVEDMLNITCEEHFSDNEFETIEDTELTASDEEYVPDNITATLSKAINSKPNCKVKDKGTGGVKKRSKRYTPKSHGIDIPEPILVESANDEPPKLMLPCKLCEKNCQSKASYIAHYKACSASPKSNDDLVDGKLPCTICGRLYGLKASLQRHMRIHLGIVEYKCELCDKQFCDAKSLRGHLYIHTGEKPYSCSFCGFKFRDKSTLIKHEKRHGTEKPFRCDVCGKDFFLGVDLRKHAKIHDVDKEFKCDQCDKQFYLIAQYKRHYRIHTGEKPYECQYCGKFFPDQTAVKCHNVTHTGIKPFQCDLCGATFSWKSLLDKHIMRHNNVRPYECTTCQRRFIQKCDLNSHEKKHTGEKTYHCTDCGKSFMDSSGLWRHKKTHTTVKNHVCSFCGKGFATSFVLKRHSTTCKRKKIIETSSNNNVKNGKRLDKDLGKDIEILINEPPELPIKSFLNAFTDSFKNDKSPIDSANIDISE